MVLITKKEFSGTLKDFGGIMVIIGITAFMVSLFRGDPFLIGTFSVFGGLFYHMGNVGLKEVGDD